MWGAEYTFNVDHGYFEALVRGLLLIDVPLLLNHGLRPPILAVELHSLRSRCLMTRHLALSSLESLTLQLVE